MSENEGPSPPKIRRGPPIVVPEHDVHFRVEKMDEGIDVDQVEEELPRVLPGPKPSVPQLPEPELQRDLVFVPQVSQILRLYTKYPTKKMKSLLYIDQQIQQHLSGANFLRHNFFVNHPHYTFIRNFLAGRHTDEECWACAATVLTDPPKRPLLRTVKSMNDLARIVRNSQRILVITGAGASDIPNFRTPTVYFDRMRAKYPTLTRPELLLDSGFFRTDPRPFFAFAKRVFPQSGRFRSNAFPKPEPTPVHCFIKFLEDRGRLMRNYTQNVDMLETAQGIERVFQCMGTFATASCTRCRVRVNTSTIEHKIMRDLIPMCRKCNPHAGNVPFERRYHIDVVRPDGLYEAGVMLPDVRFLDQPMPEEFYDLVDEDMLHCDCVFIIGTALQQNPIALMLDGLDIRIPQILVNKENLQGMQFDVELLGDAGVILKHVAHSVANLKDIKEVSISAPLVPVLHLESLCYRRPANRAGGSPHVISIDNRLWNVFYASPQSQMRLEQALSADPASSLGLVVFKKPNEHRILYMDSQRFHRLSQRIYMFWGARVVQVLEPAPSDPDTRRPARITRRRMALDEPCIELAVAHAVAMHDAQYHVVPVRERDVRRSRRR